MLNIGRFRAATCDGLSRRSFLELGASVPIGLGLTGGLLNRGAAAEAVSASRSPVIAPVRAKSVVLVWLWGAPSHLDTFDPKPDAPMEYRGPFTPIDTKLPGVQFTEIVPRLAAMSDRFSLIRSNVTFEGGHPDAGTLGLTGFKERPEPVQPNFGSIVARHRGHNGELPPFVSVGRGVPRDVVRRVEGYGGGTLGKLHDPFMVSCSDDGHVEIPALALLEGLNPNRLDDRRALMQMFDQIDRGADAAAAVSVGDWSRTFSRAYGLLTNEQARVAFDLSRESGTVRSGYGHTTFGQSCLLARRLVEAGVPYIQVNWSEYVEAITPNCDFGWDTHIYNFELLQDRHGPIFDRAFSMLLADLEQRGLLDSTLVIAMGEFGRTPKLNTRAARDHWPRCYFSLWSGAGIPAGQVIGASDRRAEDPVTEPVTPLMVGTTIAQLAGMDTQARAELNVLDGGHPVAEFV